MTRLALPFGAHAAASAARPARPLHVFLVAWALLFGLSACWSMSNALTAAPDEPAHMIKAAATVRGELLGDATEVPSERVMHVPDYVAWTPFQSTCQRGDPTIDASCALALDGSNDVLVAIETTAGDENPVYYALVGLPTLVLEDTRALYAMRLVSGLLASALLASGFAALSCRGRSSWSFAAAGIAVTPMTLFLASSVNLAAMEVPAGFALACWLSLLADADRRMDAGHAAVGAAVSAMALLCSSMLGPIWALAITAAFAIGPEARRSVMGSRAAIAAAVATLAVAVGAIAWHVVAGGQPPTGAAAGGVDFLRGAEYMLAHTLDHSTGYVGEFGWLDSPLTPTIPNVWGGLLIALPAAAMLLGRGQPRARVLALAAVVVLVPPMIQGAAFPTLGLVWQDRHELAAILALAVCSGAALDASLPPMRDVYRGRTLAVILLGGLWVMQCFAFMWNLRRHVTGLVESERRWSIMLTGPTWQPPGTWELWAGLFAIGAAAGLWLLGRAMLARLQGDDAPALAAGTADEGVTEAASEKRQEAPTMEPAEDRMVA